MTTLAPSRPRRTTDPQPPAGPARQVARERTAARLQASARKRSADIYTEIDWDGGVVPGLWFQVPERSSLWGTDLWGAMSEQQRLDLTRHEVCSIAGTGIWFEEILMQMLLRHVYSRDPRSEHVRFAFTEIADECRHSTMFGMMIEAFDCPAYRPTGLVHELGRAFKAASSPTQCFAGALFVEALLDVLQREGMRDERVQPIARQVAAVHVLEEARHMRYAADEQARQVVRAGRVEGALDRVVVASIAWIVARNLIHPDVYANVGLDRDEAHRAAERNPHWRETRRWACAKAVEQLRADGLVAGPGLALWRHAGLL